DPRHRHGHLRRAPDSRLAGAARRALRPQDPGGWRIPNLAVARRPLARAGGPLPGHAVLGQGGLQQGCRTGHAHAHDLAPLRSRQAPQRQARAGLAWRPQAMVRGPGPQCPRDRHRRNRLRRQLRGGGKEQPIERNPM
ncbi:MAG: Holo-[acyl-carrier-protein] synthase, partial [uncultured Ramlibacter sp.]